MIIRKSAQEIETMARAGTVVADTLALLEEHIQPGITTGELDAILFFDLPDDVAIERMLKRAGEENRPDDTPEVIAERLRTYHEQTEPIVEHYRATGNLVPLHADRSIEQVWSEISAALDQMENAA